MEAGTVGAVMEAVAVAKTVTRGEGTRVERTRGVGLRATHALA